MRAAIWAGVLGEVLGNLEDDGGSSGEGLEGLDGNRPVDGAPAGPKVLVFDGVVVVDVNGGDVGTEGGDGLRRRRR